MTEKLQLALEFHQKGEFGRAQNLYQEILKLEPENSDAHQFLGLLCFQTGNPNQALSGIRRAIEINPGVVPYHDNLGVVQESVGDYDGALESYQTAALLGSDDPDRFFNMAIIYEKTGQQEQSEKAYKAAIALRPDDGASHFNLGNLLKGQDRLDEAASCYRSASTCNPVIPGVLINLGNTYFQLGQYSEALDSYKSCLQQRPEDATTLANLGLVHLETGDLKKAREHLQKAVKLTPDNPAYYSAIARVDLASGNHDAATSGFQRALKLDKDHSDAVTGLAAVFRLLSPKRYRQDIVDNLLQLYAEDRVAPQDLARISANQLMHELKLHHADLNHPKELAIGWEELPTNSLLIAFLRNAINTDLQFEIFLKEVRYRILKQSLGSTSVVDNLRPLAGALSMQCFINEYLYETTPEEASIVASLKDQLTEFSKKYDSKSIQILDKLTLIAMYLPLSNLPDAATLAEANFDQCSAGFQELIQRTLREPLIEFRIRSQIPTLGELSDRVSYAVQNQYEENPYPRWFLLQRIEQSAYPIYWRKIFPHFYPTAFFDKPLKVLSAGCGTGQEAAAIARYRKGVTVTGLDLSAASLAHASRVCNQLGIDNLTFAQGDINHCARLEQTFDIIESSGVLHHMRNPLEGWKSLTACLIPGGMMKIGLYSERASIDVVAGQSIIRQQGLESSIVGIQQLRTLVRESTTENPIYSLRFSDDFYTTSSCRDLLFHVQEHCFTLEQIEQSLTELGLKFIGFELPIPDTRHRYRERYPDDIDMTNLAQWAEFEQLFPETFAAMYVFWCQKQI